MAVKIQNGSNHEALAYQKALEDARREFHAFLKTLPSDTANDLKELFQLLEAAESSADRERIADTIREILFPDSLKVDLERGFFEEDHATRQRLTQYRVSVGKEIRKRRESLGLTQRDLAEKAGIPQSHVSRLECGKHVPTHITMQKIADALKVSPSQLDPGFPDDDN